MILIRTIDGCQPNNISDKLYYVRHYINFCKQIHGQIQLKYNSRSWSQASFNVTVIYKVWPSEFMVNVMGEARGNINCLGHVLKKIMQTFHIV